MKREINLMNVKGSYDYSPEEQRIRYFIQDTLRRIFEEFGYKPLETPILCYYDMLAGKYDESNDLLNEIYKLSDQGERELGLRYDLTVPFAKYIALKKDIRLPFKRFEIGKVFRDGPVKPGRDREFLQCDVDVVGLSESLIEAELLSLWLKGYDALGIDVYIKYNNRNLIRGLIEEFVECDEDTVNKFVTVVDKMDKLSREEILDELTKLGIENGKALQIFECFELDLDAMCEKFKDNGNDTLVRGLDEVVALKETLEGIGISEYCKFAPSLARGQDYYTGNVFEVYAKNGELSCSLGGGGRYDNMITDFIDDGNVYPAVGVSFGLSTIYEILKSRVEAKNSALTDVLVVPLGTECASLRLANTLRDMSYRVEVDMSGRKLKKSFETADRENIPYIIVLGEDEVASQKCKVKDMRTKNEYEISLDNLEEIRDILFPDR